MFDLGKSYKLDSLFLLTQRFYNVFQIILFKRSLSCCNITVLKSSWTVIQSSQLWPLQFRLQRKRNLSRVLVSEWKAWWLPTCSNLIRVLVWRSSALQEPRQLQPAVPWCMRTASISNQGQKRQFHEVGGRLSLIINVLYRHFISKPSVHMHESLNVLHDSLPDLRTYVARRKFLAWGSVYCSQY